MAMYQYAAHMTIQIVHLYFMVGSNLPFIQWPCIDVRSALHISLVVGGLPRCDQSQHICQEGSEPHLEVKLCGMRACTYCVSKVDNFVNSYGAASNAQAA